MYNVWGHSYGIKALAELYRYREGDDARQSALKNLAQTQVQRLQRYEDVNGGWGYYDFDEATRKPTGIPTSFTTATVKEASRRPLSLRERDRALTLPRPRRSFELKSP